MKRRLLFLVAIGAVISGGIYIATIKRRQDIVLTGIVTTENLISSSEIQGRLEKVLVKEGDTVRHGELLGLIQPQEWKSDVAFYENSERESAAHVTQAEADFRYQSAQTRDQIQQAEATLAAAQAFVTQSEADLEFARLTFQREEGLNRQGVDSAQAFDQARTAYDGAKAHAESFRKQVQAAQASVALAKSGTEQIAARSAALEASRNQLAAVGAQKQKARVHLAYTEIRAPIDGIVDVRAALQGEVVNPGQAVVTLIDPENLWVRVDVEESYIDRIRLGDKLNVRLPSGTQREGTVFYRRVDADYATQRDVSRTKRDIKTFEIRLRCDNRDRRLAVGMTAYVTLSLTRGSSRPGFEN